MHVHNTREDGFCSFFVQHIIPQNQVQVPQVADNFSINFIGYVAPSDSGDTAYTAISARQCFEEYCRYSPALRVREVLLRMNSCGNKSIIMNRQVLAVRSSINSGTDSCQHRVKTAMYRKPPGDPMSIVKQFQRSYYNGHPALLLHGPYRGTATTNIGTSAYTRIHSFHHGTNTRCTAAAVLSSNSCHCPENLFTN